MQDLKPKELCCVFVEILQIENPKARHQKYPAFAKGKQAKQLEQLFQYNRYFFEDQREQYVTVNRDRCKTTEGEFFFRYGM